MPENAIINLLQQIWVPLISGPKGNKYLLPKPQRALFYFAPVTNLFFLFFIFFKIFIDKRELKKGTNGAFFVSSSQTMAGCLAGFIYR
jgi:hypothetical protein